MAKEPRDSLSVEITWHYLQMDGQTDGQTHDDGIYRA